MSPLPWCCHIRRSSLTKCLVMRSRCETRRPSSAHAVRRSLRQWKAAEPQIPIYEPTILVVVGDPFWPPQDGEEAGAHAADAVADQQADHRHSQPQGLQGGGTEAAVVRRQLSIDQTAWGGGGRFVLGFRRGCSVFVR